MDGNLNMETISQVAIAAKRHSVHVWFEPVSIAKSTKCIPALKQGCISYISPNVLELKAMAIAMNLHGGNFDQSESIDNIGRLAVTLKAAGAENCIVKIGARGVILVESAKDSYIHIPAEFVPKDKIINTTGAGDTLVGTTVFGLLEGKSLPEAVRRAVKASALTIQSALAVSPKICRQLLLS